MAKGIMYIDGQRVPFDGEKNVLAVIRKAGINMPTFCYYSELSTFGACRMCVVEDERGKIDASCSMEPRDGMKIRTNTEKLLKHRRMILELILASTAATAPPVKKAENVIYRSWLCNSACGRFVLRIRGQFMKRITPLPPLSATPINVSSAATAFAPARKCRGWVF